MCYLQQKGSYTRIPPVSRSLLQLSASCSGKCLWAAGTYCTWALNVLQANSSGKVTPRDSHLPATNAWSQQGPPCQELGQALRPLLTINPSFTQAGRIWRRNCSLFTLIRSLCLLLPATSEADRNRNEVMTNTGWLEEAEDMHVWAESEEGKQGALASVNCAVQVLGSTLSQACLHPVSEKRMHQSSEHLGNQMWPRKTMPKGSIKLHIICISDQPMISLLRMHISTPESEHRLERRQEDITWRSRSVSQLWGHSASCLSAPIIAWTSERHSKQLTAHFLQLPRKLSGQKGTAANVNNLLLQSKGGVSAA